MSLLSAILVFFAGCGTTVVLAAAVAVGYQLGAKRAVKVPVRKSTTVQSGSCSTDTAIVRSALKSLKFGKAEIEYACDKVRDTKGPASSKIRAALRALNDAKQAGQVLA
jgi:Holliday junction resolvasome RuvABC DNA-binding subunit